MTYVLITAVLFAAMLLYFRLAHHLRIVDIPRERSSHKTPTYRGGGILFVLAAILWFLFFGNQMPWAIAGLLVMGTVGFIDDVKSVRPGIRIIFHLAAVCLLFYELGVFSYYWYWILAAFFLTVGCINAFNFMDGINGITAFYSLVAMGTFSVLNNAGRLLLPLLPGGLPEDWGSFVPPRLVGVVFISIAVFGVYNARRRAVTFAGDVGSLSIAFIMSWLMIELMVMSNDFFWILLFAVYGIDAGYTIMRRLCHRENIFRAHRQHLYQLLANEHSWPHIWVAAAFALVQLLVNGATIWLIMTGQMTTPLFLGILAFLLALYVVLRNSLGRAPGMRTA